MPKKRRNIAKRFEDYFGSNNDLDNWKRLCDDVGVRNLESLTSITKCRKVLRSVWVNIHDLLDAKTEGKRPRKFPSQQALAEYTIRTNKVFPKKLAKEGGPAEALLAHIF